MKTVLDASLADVATRIAKGEVSATEVTEASLARIAAQNELYGAFLTVQADEARRAARAVDESRARGERLGPLAGVPLGIKDALCTRDAPTTAGSRVLTRALLREGRDGEPGGPEQGWRPPYDATVVARLRAAGAILVGKCNMDELAMGSSTENSAFFPARNPWDPSRTPGGSSGGSAVAVAARMTPGALGSDTGGSIRQPAALTGVVGVKPTYGRVSRYGLIAFASSLDQVGPFATDVRGAARLLEVIAGRDAHDATTSDAPVGDYEEACGRDVAGLRVGVPEEYFGAGVDPAVELAVRAAIRGIEGLGAEIVPIQLPHTKHAIATYYVLATAEASSNLARFDGIRFGLRLPDATDLGAVYDTTRGAGFGREVKRRIMLGTYVLSAGYYDAYYLRAQRVRTLVKLDFDHAFHKVDVIAAPVSPVVAFKLGERIDDPLAMYLADACTLPASLAGLPAMSVPCGFVTTPNTSEGVPLPVGLQLIAPAFEEERLFAIGSAWERLTEAATRRPT